MFISFVMKNKGNKFVKSILSFIDNQSTAQMGFWIIISVIVMLFISYIISLNNYKNREF